jgi:hypothetical protein
MLSIQQRKGVKNMAKTNKITQQDAARIQSATAKKNGGIVPKDSFAARAQRAASKNANQKK